MIKVTSLSDNINDNKKMWAAEGNCILIEVATVKILYDIGRDMEVILHNLKVLHISPDDINYIVLSHGHMGHSGAFRNNYSQFKNATVIYGEYFRYPKFKAKDTELKSVNNSENLSAIENGHEHISVKDYYEILSNYLYVFTIPTAKNKTFANKYLIKIGNEYITDEFKDELAVCINTSSGLLVFSGCAHRGIYNTIKRAQQLCKTSNVYAVIGGTHILNDKKLADEYCNDITDLKVKKVYPSHCTGYLGRYYIKERLKEKYGHFSTGISLEFSE